MSHKHDKKSKKCGCGGGGRGCGPGNSCRGYGGCCTPRALFTHVAGANACSTYQNALTCCAPRPRCR